MENHKRQYTQEFKDRAVELAQDLKSCSKAGHQLGVNESVIRKWVRVKNKELAIRNHDPQSSVAELERLRKENAELRKVNHILKAAAAVFCQDQLK